MFCINLNITGLTLREKINTPFLSRQNIHATLMRAIILILVLRCNNRCGLYLCIRRCFQFKLLPLKLAILLRLKRPDPEGPWHTYLFGYAVRKKDVRNERIWQRHALLYDRRLCVVFQIGLYNFLFDFDLFLYMCIKFTREVDKASTA